MPNTASEGQSARRRAQGLNPRAKGTNPRAKGTNPRAHVVSDDEECWCEPEVISYR